MTTDWVKVFDTGPGAFRAFVEVTPALMDVHDLDLVVVGEDGLPGGEADALTYAKDVSSISNEFVSAVSGNLGGQPDTTGWDEQGDLRLGAQLVSVGFPWYIINPNAFKVDIIPYRILDVKAEAVNGEESIDTQSGLSFWEFGVYYSSYVLPDSDVFTWLSGDASWSNYYIQEVIAPDPLDLEILEDDVDSDTNLGAWVHLLGEEIPFDKYGDFIGFKIEEGLFYKIARYPLNAKEGGEFLTVEDTQSARQAAEFYSKYGVRSGLWSASGKEQQARIYTKISGVSAPEIGAPEWVYLYLLSTQLGADFDMSWSGYSFVEQGDFLIRNGRSRNYFYENFVQKEPKNASLFPNKQGSVLDADIGKYFELNIRTRESKPEES